MSYIEIKTFNVSCDFCKRGYQVTTDIDLSDYLKKCGWEITSTNNMDKCPECIRPTFKCDNCNQNDRIDIELGYPVGWSIRKNNIYCRWCVELEDEGIQLRV